MPHQPDELAVGRCFSSSYKDARARFIAACDKAGAEVKSYVHPDQFGPDQEELATDVARFGPEGAKRLGIFLCGTHGLEAAAGAATFLYWLENGGPAELPDDISVVLVHAVNPYGWAHSTRGDENNVDVNRNCFDHSRGPTHNKNYRALHPLLTQYGASENAVEKALANFHVYCEEWGTAQGFEGFAAGQYEFPDGLSYGGQEASWSYKSLLRLLDDFRGAAQSVVVIDWHTGIGDFGEPFIIVNPAGQKSTFASAEDCWGPSHVNPDDIYGEGVSISHSGLVISAAEEALRDGKDKKILGAVIEWGTFDIDTMFGALLIDRFLRSDAGQINDAERRTLQRRAIESFIPADPEWRRSVLAQSTEIYRRTIRYLVDTPL
ncbi:DUF2817 domain-containing protein [Parasphingorhabdus flavimaris]|uniref:DUF2817 domain-containing protein n=1 Tax=Parasphingorhabdus flavimaris TaxID=266812 RepID=A0ABX2N357_9SPHN|nr:DUF2817 domain-containing protein [Parasphingorhabdus flavimaris]NVD28140.1 DUF2817 domain-containing protein [Parasphingorhabdus flavimaris]|tara:strand:- start:6112 stop:7245 length:1134 start_codon:yes stop_codon:yes gene_type:complete